MKGPQMINKDRVVTSAPWAVCFLLFIAIIPLEPAAAQSGPKKLRVLVIYTEDAIGRIQDPSETSHADDNNSIADYALNRIEDMNEVLINSGLGDLVEVEFGGLTTPDEYDENNVSDPGVFGDTSSVDGLYDTVIDFEFGGVTFGGQDLETIRDELDIDVAIIVASPENIQPPSVYENGRVTGLLGDSEGTPSRWVFGTHELLAEDGYTWAHELGHLGGVAHPQEEYGSDPLEDGARAYETEDATGMYGSVAMGTNCGDYEEDNPGKTCERLPQYSDKDADVLDAQGGVRGKLGDSDHDAVETLRNTLPKMADYAETLDANEPPPEPNLQAFFMYCRHKEPRFDVTWWPGDQHTPVSSYQVQRQTNSGLWQGWYGGGQSCTIIGGSISGLDYRIRARNANGNSDWVNFTLGNTYCISSGGGF